MISHSLLALACVVTASSFALSSCSGANIDSELITYPAHIVNTNWEECLPAEQQQIVSTEVKQDIRSILQRQIRK